MRDEALPTTFHTGQFLVLHAGPTAAPVELAARVVAAQGVQLTLDLVMRPLLMPDLLPGAAVTLGEPKRGDARLGATVVDGGHGSRLVVRLVADADTLNANRRGFYRVSMRLADVDLIILRTGHAALVRSQLLDLSGGGASLLTPASPERSARLALRTPLLTHQGLGNVAGRIVWDRLDGPRWRVGIEFTGLREPERDRIVGAVLLEEVRRRLPAANPAPAPSPRPLVLRPRG